MAYDEEVEETFVLRHNNRAQRSVNRHLRRALKNYQLQSDRLFLELCSVDKSAEMALERLWSDAGLTCDVTDYDAIVEGILSLISRKEYAKDGLSEAD
jgi:hypothetical protein